MTRALAAVVPCYNAGPRLVPVITRLCSLLDHVVIVDDGSTDGAVAAVEASGAQILTFSENRGKGHAILDGFRAALANPEVTAVCVVDADGQHDPGELPRLYEEFVRQRADLVIGGRRFDRENVLWRSRFGNRLTALVTAWLLKQAVPDTQSGFRVHSRQLAEDVLASVTGGRYETEMEILLKTVRAGYKLVTVPVQTIYETGNPSSHFKRLSDSARIWYTMFAAALSARNR